MEANWGFGAVALLGLVSFPTGCAPSRDPRTETGTITIGRKSIDVSISYTSKDFIEQVVLTFKTPGKFVVSIQNIVIHEHKGADDIESINPVIRDTINVDKQDIDIGKTFTFDTRSVGIKSRKTFLDITVMNEFPELDKIDRLKNNFHIQPL